MSLQVRFILTIIFILGFLCVDIVANKLYLYEAYRWLDGIMHVMGGFAAGLWGLIIVAYWRPLSVGVLASICGALLIGFIWEIMEYVFHISHLGPGFIADTASDLIMDIIGGIIAYFLWTKLPTQIQKTNTN